MPYSTQQLRRTRRALLVALGLSLTVLFAVQVQRITLNGETEDRTPRIALPNDGDGDIAGLETPDAGSEAAFAELTTAEFESPFSIDAKLLISVPPGSSGSMHRLLSEWPAEDFITWSSVAVDPPEAHAGVAPETSPRPASAMLPLKSPVFAPPPESISERITRRHALLNREPSRVRPPRAAPEASREPVESSLSFVVSITALITSIVSLFGVTLTSVTTWRRERRERLHEDLDLERKRLELEKLRREVGGS